MYIANTLALFNHLHSPACCIGMVSCYHKAITSQLFNNTIDINGNIDSDNNKGR
ncbi:MAG: hypothetical protein IMF14_05135 [Proteobacteria bacterium]|nr:hypothetical protein [Pseudomonadota bacterium]